MELGFAVLADSAVARPDGKLDIHGAGVDQIVAPAVPARHPRLALAGKVLVTRAEAARKHDLSVLLVTADGAPLAEVSWPIAVLAKEKRERIPRGGTTGLSFVANFEDMVFPAHGRYGALVRWDGSAVATIPFSVIEPQ